MKNKILLILILFISQSIIFAQDTIHEFTYKSNLHIGADINVRNEYRHGYKTPFMELDDYGYKNKADFITSQRSRIIFDYDAYSFIKFYFVLQNYSVWGNNSFINEEFGKNTSIHEAWGQLFFNDITSMKFGRMELVYDDQRIFGNQNWSNIGLSHDLVLFKVESLFDLDIGVAYNNNPENEHHTEYYNVKNNYKSMQFMHLIVDFDYVGFTGLFLNNGIPEKSYGYNFSENKLEFISEKPIYSQTLGGGLSFSDIMFSANINYYIQKGYEPSDWVYVDSLASHGQTIEDLNKNLNTDLQSIEGKGKKINSNYLSVFAGANFSNFEVQLGYEKLSGNNYDTLGVDLNDENNSFLPLHGSNHGFNGALDQFYTGYLIHNYSKFNVGLQDISIDLSYKMNKILASLSGHYFMSAGSALYFDKENNLKEVKKLGTEIDFKLGYTIVPDVAKIQFGYSHLLPTEDFAFIKGVYFDNLATNNWAWIMFTFTPDFYKTK